VNQKLVLVRFFSAFAHCETDLLLPEPWVKVVLRGQVYYHDKSTKGVSWTAPRSTASNNPLFRFSDSDFDVFFDKSGGHTGPRSSQVGAASEAAGTALGLQGPEATAYFQDRKTRDVDWAAPIPLSAAVRGVYETVETLHRSHGLTTFFAVLSDEKSALDQKGGSGQPQGVAGRTVHLVLSLLFSYAYKSRSSDEQFTLAGRARGLSRLVIKEFLLLKNYLFHAGQFVQSEGRVAC